MEISVEIDRIKRRVRIRRDATGEDLLEKLGIYPDEAIILIDGALAPIKEKLNGRDVKIILFSSKG